MEVIEQNMTQVALQINMGDSIGLFPVWLFSDARQLFEQLSVSAKRERHLKSLRKRLLDLLEPFVADDCDLDKTEETVLSRYLEWGIDAWKLLKDMPQLQDLSFQYRAEKDLFDKISDRVRKQKLAELELGFLIYNRVMNVFLEVIKEMSPDAIDTIANENVSSIDEEGNPLLFVGLRILVLMYLADRKDTSNHKIELLIDRFLDACVGVVSLFYRMGEKIDILEGLEPEKRIRFMRVISARVFDGLSSQDIQDIASERVTLSEI